MVKIAYAPIYHHPLPAGHRFPMAKYSLLPEQLRYEATVGEEQFFTPEPLPEAVILRCHSPAYWQKLQSLNLSRAEERRTGFPLSEQLVLRERVIGQGTLDCARFALQHGVALNIAGGTHHAFWDRGEGFCLLNDIAMAALQLLDEAVVQKVLVVDLDVHQGNGTAQLMAAEPRVFTFSMHGAKNYPLSKERSDLDIALPDGCEDRAYLDKLNQVLPQLLEEQAPDLVFYQSGVDVLASDKLGRLALSMQGCKERDRSVFAHCHQRGIPVAVSMGGGYSERLADIVDAHAQTFRLAMDFWA